MAGGKSDVSILIADDDPTARLLAATALEDLARVVEAEHGLAAIDRLSPDIDLVVLDLGMPVLDGFQVLEHIRANAETKHIPVIAVTGRDDVIAIERAFSMGATSFICKPVQWRIFQHQVRFVLQSGKVRRDVQDARVRSDLRERSLGMLSSAIDKSLAEFARLSAGSIDPPTGLREQIGAAIAPLQRTHRRIQRVLDIAGDQAPFLPRPTHCAEIGASVLRKLGERMGPGVVDRVRFRDSARNRVVCDPEMIGEALLEILDNALSVTGPGDEVRFDALLCRDDAIRFEIQDRGPGISEDLLALPLEDWPMRQGSGLGLPIAQAIARKHGGHLGIFSEQNSGTEVFLRLAAPGAAANG